VNPLLVLDGVGWTYITIFIVWNLSLLSGFAFLWTHRQHPSLRMRRLPLLFAGVSVLHIYGALCTLCTYAHTTTSKFAMASHRSSDTEHMLTWLPLAYPFGAVFPCSVEFWAMSILVPLGMALFHASNSQFLHLAARQKHFARMSSLKDHEPIDEKKAQEVVNSRWKRIMNGMERADNIERTLIFIGIGMAVQVSISYSQYSIAS